MTGFGLTCPEQGDWMKKLIFVFIILAVLALAGCAAGGEGEIWDDKVITENFEPLDGIHHVQIEVEGYGTITVELNGDMAPITVGNFIGLAKRGFYDGLTFHRIIDGFMIQGGDPYGDGTGGSGVEIEGEFKENGHDNDISHVRGTISMARNSISYNSASSQFFIVHEDSPHLDGHYAAFGHVTEGMDIVDKICRDTPVQDDNGRVLKKDQPVIKSIAVTD
jgi:peptidyl-prolyl cis-trans isomerase B (cyclophilin B)